MTDVLQEPGVEHRSLRDLVLDRLRSLIVDGVLPPGSRLVERSLADQLGVSRVPVREALQALVHEGFAEERPRRVVVVREPTDDELEQLLEVREALETVCCVRLAQQVGAAAAGPLDRALAQARSSLAVGDDAAAIAAGGLFHAALLEAAGDTLAARLLAPLAHRLRWLLRQHTDAAAMYDEHRQIRDAVVAGNATLVRTLLADHLRSSRRALHDTRRRGRP